MSESCITLDGVTEVPRASLGLNSAWMLAGNLVYALSQWGMITAIAKLGTPEMVGQFVLGLAVTAPVSLLAGLQLRQVQATDVAGRYSLAQYVRLRLITVGLSILTISAILLLVRYDTATRTVIFIMAIAKGAESLSDIIHGHFQRLERLDLVSTSLMVKGPVALAAVASILWATRSLVCAVSALVAALILVMLVCDAYRAAALRGHRPGPSLILLASSFRWQSLRRERDVLFQMCRTSLPLGVGSAVASLALLVPRYSVEHYLGSYSLGIYGAIAYLQQAGNVVINAAGQAALPRMAFLFEHRKLKDFLTIQCRLLVLAAGIGLAGLCLAAMLGRTLLTLLYQAAYASHVNVLCWQMLSSGMAYVASLAVVGLTSMRVLAAQLPLFIAVSTVSCGLSLVLIPKLGLVGAPISTLCAMTLEALLALGMMAAALRRHQPSHWTVAAAPSVVSN